MVWTRSQWQWNDGKWEEWKMVEGKNRGQKKPTYSKPQANKKTPSWGKWKCHGCGNVQSGSQCQGCKSKYWEVEWSRITADFKPLAPPSSKARGGGDAPWHEALHQLLNLIPATQEFSALKEAVVNAHSKL